MPRQALQVVPLGTGWALKFERNDLPISEWRTKAEAIEAGKRKAKTLGCQLSIHSDDPRLPKDEKL